MTPVILRRAAIISCHRGPHGLWARPPGDRRDRHRGHLGARRFAVPLGRPALGATMFALVVFGGAAVALQRAGVAIPAAAAVGIGGVVWTFVHPLMGTPAMVVFLAGAGSAERSRRSPVVTTRPLVPAPFAPDAGGSR